jgi:hypothetical protein
VPRRSPVWGATVQNHSPLPVYDLRLEFIADSDQRVAAKIQESIFPPGVDSFPWAGDIRKIEGLGSLDPLVPVEAKLTIICEPVTPLPLSPSSRSICRALAKVAVICNGESDLFPHLR